MPAALMPAVETLREESVEAVNGVRHLLTLGLDDEVVVGPHQAPGDDTPSPQLGNLRQEQDESTTVVVVREDDGTADAARGDVEEAVGELTAGPAWHVALDRSAAFGGRAVIVTLSLQGLSLGRGSTGRVR